MHKKKINEIKKTPKFNSVVRNFEIIGFYLKYLVIIYEMTNLFKEI